MGRKKLAAGRDPNLPLLCNICGDKARGNNFSVFSCVSCKSFFRRYALLNIRNLQCRYQGNCVITKETRNDCLPCRLKKCLEIGMDPLMIRCPSGQQANSMKTRRSILSNESQIQLSAPKPLNLLQNDCSNLTSDQWNLLSNIIRSYDEENMINRAKNLVDEKSSLPLKLRLKSQDTIDIISQSYKNFLPLLERSPDVRCLSRYAHRALVLHNVVFIGGINATFIARETNAFANATFMTASSLLYGSDFMMKCARDSERLEPNGNLIKLMLFVLIFSNNCSVVTFNDGEDIKTMSSSIELIHIQNIYVTMLWKYLVYLYGYNGAVMHFSVMIKNILDILHRTEELLKNLTYNALVDKVVTHTERTLLVAD